MEKIETIYEILKQNDKYLDKDGNLLKSVIQTDAMNLDERLLNILTNNETTRDTFFKEVNGILIFDKILFSWVINNKMFLPDSYTSFKNKIGLIDSNRDYIVNSNDVCLSFPYKDCILEFDSTKETEERNEVFLNETLLKKEIDTLLEPKVFSNAKIINQSGTNLITEFDITKNLIIKGNNLIVMNSLLPVYAGRIKLMYWDILYNTNNDQVPYNDSFKHSSWLTMMKNRLEIAKKLLSNDGIILIQCDKNEDSYLTVLMDELFGRDNHVCSISIKSNNISGNKTQHKEKTILKNKDTILVYKKSSELVIKPQYVEKTRWDTHYNKWIDFLDDNSFKIRDFKEVLIENNILEKNETIKEDFLLKDNFYSFIKKYRKNIFRFVDSISAELKQKSLENSNKIVKDENNNLAYNGQRISLLDSSIKEIDNEDKFVQLLGDLWTDIDFQNTQNEGNGVSLPAGKKPERLLRRIIDMFTQENDIVLDAYFGTGTTGAVAMKMNRRFIGIEQLNDHYEKSIKRLIGVIDGDDGGISKFVNWKGGGSFVCCELAKLNENYIEKIASATNKNIDEIFEEIINSGFVTYRVDINNIKNNKEMFDKLTLDDKKKLLIEVLDKNLLYVNYSDIDDESYKIKENDKKFTNSFYEGK